LVDIELSIEEEMEIFAEELKNFFSKDVTFEITQVLPHLW
jgi:hypothetical protein